MEEEQAGRSRTRTNRLPRSIIPKAIQAAVFRADSTRRPTGNILTESETSRLATLLNAQGLTKSFGATTLFRNIGFQVEEGDRIGVIGPNGSGKSTLLGVLAGAIDSDDGEVARRRLVRMAYVAQASEFAPGVSAREVVNQALGKAGVHAEEWPGRAAETLGRAGFENFDHEAAAFSGGWKKRLSIAIALAGEPDILLLDEPTNHLDLAGIAWLEELLGNAAFASVTISHDRYFLENVATSILELNRQYPEGYLRVRGNLSYFLEKKEEFLEAQTKRQESLENRVKTEIEWLRRGPKARTTKSKSRIDSANELIGELKQSKSRSQVSSAGIDFVASTRQTKRLVEMKAVRYSIPDRADGLILSGLDFDINAGMRVGLVGPNGSGKTTLLRLLRGELRPESGQIKLANQLRIVYFDQNRVLDETVTLRRALAPESDSVIYQDRVIHVAAWAERFMFAGDQLNQPVARLSGGERARVLIANLMLQPADLLLLDEPTNDLDIPTLEILEESLLEYTGALVLVTHDRSMLDRVSTVVLGLDGAGNAERFADYSQWDEWVKTQQKQREQQELLELRPTGGESGEGASGALAAFRKKLSYLDARDYATIEARVEVAEEALASARAVLESPEVVVDAVRLQAAMVALDAAQADADTLYARWAELEARASG